MGEPEKVPINLVGAPPAEPGKPSAVNRLREKAEKLKGPRGKYRCRKCHELPCTCPDPKQSTQAPASAVPGPLATPSQPLFTETNSKRLLEAGFGIPTVLTNCKLWALTEAEALELCKPTADVLNEFVSVDPRWVSLSILSVSLGSIMARKAVLYSAWKRAMAIDQAQRQPPPDQNRVPVRMDEPPAPEPNGNSHGEDKTPGPSGNMDMLQ